MTCPIPCATPSTSPEVAACARAAGQRSGGAVAVRRRAPRSVAPLSHGNNTPLLQCCPPPSLLLPLPMSLLYSLRVPCLTVTPLLQCCPAQSQSA